MNELQDANYGIIVSGILRLFLSNKVSVQIREKKFQTFVQKHSVFITKTASGNLTAKEREAQIFEDVVSDVLLLFAACL